jgi:hypothetical protein
MYQTETTARASAVSYRSATAVGGTWQPPLLFLMPKGGPKDNGGGSNGGDNDGGISGTSSDISTSHTVFAAVLLVCGFVVESS